MGPAATAAGVAEAAVINYGNKIIKNVASAKFLGLTIDNLLKWDNHIYQLTSKLSSAYYVMRSLRGARQWRRLPYNRPRY